MSSSPAIRPAPSQVQAWRDALASMKTNVPPCPGLTAAKWATVHEAALDALDRFGAELTEHDWRAPELFGVHPQLGVIRPDFCGPSAQWGARHRCHRRPDPAYTDHLPAARARLRRRRAGVGVQVSRRGLLKAAGGLAALLTGSVVCAAGLFVLSRIEAVGLERWPLRYQFLAGLLLYAVGAVVAVQVLQNGWRRLQGEQ